MEIRDVFAQNLRRIRQAKSMSQEDLAHRASIDRTYVSALERGVYSPTIEVVAKIADALEVQIVELLTAP